MRNLNLLKSEVIKLNSDDSCNQFYLNRNSNNVYLLTTNGTATCINVENNTSENFHLTTSPIKLTYLSVTSEISIIDSKSIFIFDQNLNLNVSYNFTNECQIAEYSPGQDLLAVLTNDLKVQVLNIDSYGTFSLINEIKLDDYKYVNQFINVGWGSKETQFHGSEGKDARKIRTIENNSDTNEISVTNANITWRGDGLLFAVSFIRGKDYAFLVLNKDGVPQYSSEICPGLESPLCWKPSGNLIAGVQKLPNKYQIVFFEKNGLRHGEFTISDKAKVQKISWSSDSEILCILYENNNIQLWTINNYHWYLKQSIQFGADIILSDLYWDTGFETKNGKIMYVLYNSNIVIYEWIWNVNYSKGSDDNDLACVVVIDGTQALITSFKKSSIPPPMSAVTLKTDKIINFVVFGASLDHPNDLCAIFDDYSCNTYKCLEPFKYELVREFRFDCKNSIPLSENHFLWINTNTFLSYSNRTIRKYVLSEQLDVDTKVIDVNDIVISIEIVCATKQIIIQLISGDIYTLDIETDSIKFLFRIPSACDIIKSCLIGDQSVVFGLDRFNRFYVNNNCTANTITSFFIHSEFLLLTTSKHMLICVQLNDNGLQMLHNNAPNMFMRQIERGSKIIVAIQRGRKVILQMPRGNLETICPRIMSLHMIKNLLDSNQYSEAFQIMKVERINLNILYDHNPRQFLENIELFIKQIDDATHLNMFLLELQDEDVTQTMYSMCYANKLNGRDGATDKKTLIADTFVKCVSSKVETQKKFLLSIVTALKIKKNQTDLERALNIIYQMKLDDRILAEKALEHLLLLVSINELYNIALGTYNFDLIMFVVTKSQKDPKEYIPFLNQLNRLDENYKKYTIDKYLKRYANALKWITKCDDKFTECLEFIKTHNLYKESLELFNGHADRYTTVCEEYGNYLLDKRCFIEAGIMFERSGQFEKAIESYKLGGQWSHCIRCALKLNYNSVQLNKLYLSLTDDLVTQRQYKDASIIFIEHLNDPEMAIEVLTNGRLWSDCLRLAYAHNRLDMIETHVKPGILQHAEILQSQIETNLNEFKMKIERLKIVKSLKKTELEDSNEQFIEDGLYSDTASVISKSSMISKSSFRSFRSSKNRRKHERKLLSLKEGSKFEDIALIQFLHNLINNTFAMRQETYDLCTILMMFNEDTLARKLQKLLENLLKLIKVSEKDIWSEDLDTTNNFMFGPDATSNVASDIMKNDTLNGNKQNVLEPQFRYPPQQTDVHWKLFTLD